MRKVISALMALALTAIPALAAPQKDIKETDRLENAGTVLEEIMNVPDDIPQDLIDKAECIVVFPSVLKAAFIVGGSYGRGAMVCRSGEHFTGPWGAPSMAALEGASFGFQLGGQATDFVLLIMNPRGASAILSSKVKLGADMAAAAGPKGRDASASTDATMRAEILTYSRSRGLFAGISRSKARRCVPIMMQTRECTGKKLARPKSYAEVLWPCRRPRKRWFPCSIRNHLRIFPILIR